MKKSKSIAVIGLLFMLILMLMTVTVNAETEDTRPDTAGNSLYFSVDTDQVVPGRDLYWTGIDLNLDHTALAGDIIGIGKGIDLNQVDVGSSLRFLTYKTELSQVHIKNNLTAAAFELKMDRDCSAAGVYLLGSKIELEGTADALVVFGEEVTINGKINGDATVEAGKITIGENAEITGNLKLISNHEPQIDEKAKINAYSFEKELGETLLTNSEDENGWIRSFISGLLSALIIAVVLVLLLNKNIDQCKSVLVKRPFPIIISGIVALFLIPGLIVFLFILRFSIILSILLSIVIVVIFLLSEAYAGAVIGRICLKKMGVWPASLIGAGAFYAVGMIPYFGVLWKIACCVLLLGWVIQKIWVDFEWRGDRLKNSKLAEIFISKTDEEDAPKE